MAALGLERLLGGDPADVAKAPNRAAHTLPAIVGFTVGCGLGAACEAALGTWSLCLAGLALLAKSARRGICILSYPPETGG
jgi:hypothetical protein